jgi:hypothetical protein
VFWSRDADGKLYEQNTKEQNGQDSGGVNAWARGPQSRYGPAAPERGDCASQLLVSDAVKPPER